jgi:hypothetical protein
MPSNPYVSRLRYRAPRLLPRAIRIVSDCQLMVIKGAGVLYYFRDGRLNHGGIRRKVLSTIIQRFPQMSFVLEDLSVLAEALLGAGNAPAPNAKDGTRSAKSGICRWPAAWPGRDEG